MSKGNYRTSTVNERWGEGVSIHLSHGPMGIRLILIFYYFNVILLKSSRAPAPPPLLLFQTRLSIMKGPLFFRKEYLLYRDCNIHEIVCQLLYSVHLLHVVFQRGEQRKIFGDESSFPRKQ